MPEPETALTADSGGKQKVVRLVQPTPGLQRGINPRRCFRGRHYGITRKLAVPPAGLPVTGRTATSIRSASSTPQHMTGAAIGLILAGLGEFGWRRDRLLTRHECRSHSELQAGPESRRRSQRMVVPLTRARTQSRGLLEAPNRLISIRQAKACASAGYVIETCCRVTTAAFRCLAAEAHAAAECDLISCRVNSMVNQNSP